MRPSERTNWAVQVAVVCAVVSLLLVSGAVILGGLLLALEFFAFGL